MFILVPKNSGLGKYRQIGLLYLSKLDILRVIEVRGEDIPFWICKLQEKGISAVGLTGEDLFQDFCLGQTENKPRIIKRIVWNDPEAKFGKPTLCLIGPKGRDLLGFKKAITVCVASKYKNIAERYLAKLSGKGFSFDVIYINGCVESSITEGIADLVIDIVYTGSSIERAGLKVYEKIFQSDFLIIGDQYD